MNRDKAERLLTLARESIYSGAAKEGREASLRSNITLIRILRQQMDEAEAAMLALFEHKKASQEERDEMAELIDNLRTIQNAKKECIIIVARRLLQIIYTIYTRNVPYDPERVFVARPNQ